MEIVKLKKAELEKAGIPFTAGTLFKWHSTGEHPELFLKLGYRVCLDLDAFRKWVNEAKTKTQKRTAKLSKLKRES